MQAIRLPWCAVSSAGSGGATPKNGAQPRRKAARFIPASLPADALFQKDHYRLISLKRDDDGNDDIGQDSMSWYPAPSFANDGEILLQPDSSMEVQNPASPRIKQAKPKFSKLKSPHPAASRLELLRQDARSRGMTRKQSARVDNTQMATVTGEFSEDGRQLSIDEGRDHGSRAGDTEDTESSRRGMTGRPTRESYPSPLREEQRDEAFRAAVRRLLEVTAEATKQPAGLIYRKDIRQQQQQHYPKQQRQQQEEQQQIQQQQIQQQQIQEQQQLQQLQQLPLQQSPNPSDVNGLLAESFATNRAELLSRFSGSLPQDNVTPQDINVPASILSREGQSSISQLMQQRTNMHPVTRTSVTLKGFKGPFQARTELHRALRGEAAGGRGGELQSQVSQQRQRDSEEGCVALCEALQADVATVLATHTNLPGGLKRRVEENLGELVRLVKRWQAEGQGGSEGQTEGESRGDSSAREVHSQERAQQGDGGIGLPGRTADALSSALQEGSMSGREGGEQSSDGYSSAAAGSVPADPDIAATRQSISRMEFVNAMRRLVEVTREVSGMSAATQSYPSQQFSSQPFHSQPFPPQSYASSTGRQLSQSSLSGARERWNKDPTRLNKPRDKGPAMQGGSSVSRDGASAATVSHSAGIAEGEKGDRGLEFRRGVSVPATAGAERGRLVGTSPTARESPVVGAFAQAGRLGYDGSGEGLVADDDDRSLSRLQNQTPGSTTGANSEPLTSDAAAQSQPLNSAAVSPGSDMDHSTEGVMKAAMGAWQCWWEETGRKVGDREENLRMVAQKRLLSQYEAAASLAFILSSVESTPDAQAAAARLVETCSTSTDLSHESLMTALQVLSLSGRSNVVLACRDLLHRA